MGVRGVINKVMQSESLMYIFFGGCTTILNYLSYEVGLLLGIEYKIANIIAFIISIIFAYITNKIYVFKSVTDTSKQWMREFLLFIISRLGTFFIETVLLIILVDYIWVNAHVVRLS